MAIRFPSALDGLVANKPIDETAVANTVPRPVANRRGKYADADKRREYMRKYMAARRAK